MRLALTFYLILLMATIGSSQNGNCYCHFSLERYCQDSTNNDSCFNSCFNKILDLTFKYKMSYLVSEKLFRTSSQIIEIQDYLSLRSSVNSDRGVIMDSAFISYLRSPLVLRSNKLFKDSSYLLKDKFIIINEIIVKKNSFFDMENCEYTELLVHTNNQAPYREDTIFIVENLGYQKVINGKYFFESISSILVTDVKNQITERQNLEERNITKRMNLLNELLRIRCIKFKVIPIKKNLYRYQVGDGLYLLVNNKNINNLIFSLMRGGNCQEIGFKSD